MGSHRFCSPSECCRIWNELHVMPQTIDTHYKPNAETSNFDDYKQRGKAISPETECAHAKHGAAGVHTIPGAVRMNVMFVCFMCLTSR